MEKPGEPAPGHFGLAVEDYTHSTAPNRRFADLATQRLLKALIDKKPSPYPDAELATIAQNCTLKEDAARKVEREMRKRIAALVMSDRVGQRFDALVVGIRDMAWYSVKSIDNSAARTLYLQNTFRMETLAAIAHDEANTVLSHTHNKSKTDRFL